MKKEISKDKIDNVIIIIMMIAFSIFYLSFAYPDFVETTRSGISLIDVLVKGKLREFYFINENIQVSNNYGLTTAIYDFPIYVAFAIWNIPNYIYEKLTGCYSLDNPFGLFWAKSIALPFFIGIIYETNNCIKEITGEGKLKHLVLYTFTSFFVFTPILIMGQYDVICLFFVVLGLRAYLQGNEKKFVLMFAIASLFKMFALFIYIPIVCFLKKDIKSLFLYTFKGVSLLAICKILQKVYFIKSDSAKEYLSGHFIDFIFQSQFPLFYGTTSLFFVLYVLFILWCYFVRIREEWNIKISVIFIATCSLSIFFVTSLTHPQWLILIWPFFFILIYSSPFSAIGLIVDTIMGIGVIIAQISYYAWVFSVNVEMFSFWGRTIGRSTDYGNSLYANIERILGTAIASRMIALGGGIFIGALLFSLVLLNPFHSSEKMKDRWYISPELKESHTVFYAVRLIMVLAVGISLMMIAIPG